ncbi:MAG: ATP-dependent Clp protease ATP-binding subunit ClpB, partial [Patescibacteria group bacterium]|nr:ATP-dependent Clp protease ATP-binding subunit ClpB [Patescibacteria group bacterium]
ESHSVARLIGAPPGYVGYDEGGQLTEAVRRRPYSVILLDEIEKAHPQVFNIFLQVFDEGRLTDSKGVTVDFRNTILIMTSNLGSSVILEEKDKSQVKEKMWQILHSHFRPEFLNRLDSVVLFNALGAKEVMEIAKLQLEIVGRRMRENNIELSYSDDVISLIAEEGFDPNFGARPLKRVIEEKIVDEIALRIIDGTVKPGEKINLLVKDSSIVIE